MVALGTIAAIATSVAIVTAPAAGLRIQATGIFLFASKANDQDVIVEIGGTEVMRLSAGESHAIRAYGSGQNLLDVTDITVKEGTAGTTNITGYYVTQ